MPEPTLEKVKALAAKVAELAQGLGVDVDADDVRERFNTFVLGENTDTPDYLAQILLRERGTKKKRKKRESSGSRQVQRVPPGIHPPEWEKLDTYVSPSRSRQPRPRASDENR